ncbi:hypothetical protein MMC07_001966 [Pseudocyphellaria aurata]|nr:hypothetical protein [Pseudocyphellaria aurata]
MPFSLFKRKNKDSATSRSVDSRQSETPAPPYLAQDPKRSTAGLGSSLNHGASRDLKDDPFAFLSTFDTAFLIDDSYSMTGRSWEEVAAVLKSITPICTAHDADGIDIYFLNKSDDQQFRNVTSADKVDRIFKSVRPMGATPTGARLDAILTPYLADLRTLGDKLKPLNIIVITDGQPTDDPQSVIVKTAKRLDDLEAPPWQVGIQFFQVGQDKGATEALRHLDDGLVSRNGGIRDIVDTVPWNGVRLNADGILKVVLGAVNRRLDRKSVGAK